VAFVALVLVTLVARRFNTLSAGVVSGGFAASCIEIILLLAFQTLYGYVYQVLGIIVTIFMAGLAFGATIGKRAVPDPTFRLYGWVQTVIGGLCLGIAGFLGLAESLDFAPPLLHGTIFMLTFVVSTLIGAEFSVASRLSGGDIPRIASNLYSTDLLASALGAFLVGSFLVPVLGPVGVCLLVGFLSLMTAVLAFRRSQVIADVARSVQGEQ
jgi:spermidine synthase